MPISPHHILTHVVSWWACLHLFTSRLLLSFTLVPLSVSYWQHISLAVVVAAIHFKSIFSHILLPVSLYSITATVLYWLEFDQFSRLWHMSHRIRKCHSWATRQRYHLARIQSQGEGIGTNSEEHRPWGEHHESFLFPNNRGYQTRHSSATWFPKRSNSYDAMISPHSKYSSILTGIILDIGGYLSMLIPIIVCNHQSGYGRILTCILCRSEKSALSATEYLYPWRSMKKGMDEIVYRKKTLLSLL